MIRPLRESPCESALFLPMAKNDNKAPDNNTKTSKKRERQTDRMCKAAIPSLCVLSYAQDRNTHTIEVNGEGTARHPSPISPCAAGATDDRIGCSSSSIC